MGYRRKTFRSAPHGDEIEGIPLVSRSVAWVEFDGTLEAASRSRPVPIVIKSHGSQRSLGFGECAIQFQGFQSRSLGCRRDILGSHGADNRGPDDAVTIG